MRILVPIAGALLALAACGDGDSPFDDDPTATPTVGSVSQSPRPTAATPTPSGCATTEYEVQDGDVLGAIAERFGVTTDAIAEASNLANPDVLAIGDKLTIPCPEEAGETEVPAETGEPAAGTEEPTEGA